MAGVRNISQGDEKIIGIELLRFASALAVLVFHYQHLAFVGTRLPPDFVREAQPFYPWLKLWYVNGFYGVQVFWCISGFIFYWKYGKSIAERGISAWRFSALRFSRLYPLHIVTLLFVAAMQVLYHASHGDTFIYSNNDPYHFILQLAMASNWSQTSESFNGPIWSISVEVLVYAVFFVTLRYISGSALFLGAMALGAALVQITGLSVHPVYPCIMFFYLGCLTAWVYGRQAESQRRSAIATAGAAALAAVALLWMVLHGMQPKTFLVLFTPALILLCVKLVPDIQAITRWLVPAGNMTYSSYLLHVPLQITAVTICAYAGWHMPFYSPACFLTFMAVTLFFSYWSYRLLEMPAQSRLRKLLLRSKAPVLARSPNPT